jgi:hypothetical protein
MVPETVVVAAVPAAAGGGFHFRFRRLRRSPVVAAVAPNVVLAAAVAFVVVSPLVEGESTKSFRGRGDEKFQTEKFECDASTDATLKSLKYFLSVNVFELTLE